MFIQVKIRFNKCTISSNTVTNTAINAFPVVKYEEDWVKLYEKDFLKYVYLAPKNRRNHECTW